jgi:hypothetical protein
MKCQDLQELISAYVDGELPQTQRDFVEEHLQRCRGCQLTLAEYTRISNQMSSLRSTPPLPDIKEEIMSKTNTENVINKPRRWLSPVLIAAPFVLALAIALPIVIPTLALTPEKVLAKAGDAMLNVKSFRAQSYDPVPFLHDLYEFSGNSFHDVAYSGTGGEEINIGDRIYLRGMLVDSAPITLSEMQIMIPSAKMTQAQLDMLTRLEVLPEESIDGVECFHYRGTVDNEKLIKFQEPFFTKWFYHMFARASKMAGKAFDEEKVSQSIKGMLEDTAAHTRTQKIIDEFWIGKSDYAVRQMKTLDDSTAISGMTKFYDFNVPIEIKAPLDAQGNLLPGWSLAVPDSVSLTGK